MARVPLQNLFYLLCYASNCLEVRGFIDVSAVRGTTPMELYAAVLDACVARLHRKGVPRRYRTFAEVTSAPRGRISLSPSMSRGLLQRRLLCCEIDALTADIPFNRLVKAALRRVAGHPRVAARTRTRLRAHIRFLGRISDITPGPRDFAAARGERLDAAQRFLLQICELVLVDLLIDPSKPGLEPMRFDRWDGTPQNMGRLFESFVANFLKREQGVYRVSRPGILWRVEASRDDLRLLPRMHGDVLLWHPDQRILVECKYSAHTLQNNRGSAKVKSSNLYQLYTYVSHLGDDGGPPLAGMLLYPQVERRLALDYELRGHRIAVRTLNLDQPWHHIHDDLLALVAGATDARSRVRE